MNIFQGNARPIELLRYAGLFLWFCAGIPLLLMKQLFPVPLETTPYIAWFLLHGLFGMMYWNLWQYLPGRTDTAYYQDIIFPHADAIFFIRGRVKFYNVDGTLGPSTSGAPSVLLAYGKENVDVLRADPIRGKFVLLNQNYQELSTIFDILKFKIHNS